MGWNGASSRSSSCPATPYKLHEDANRNRGTPAHLASSARRTEARWLMAYVQAGLTSPRGSLDSAARWMTASNPLSSDSPTSRTSIVSAGPSGGPSPKVQAPNRALSRPATSSSVVGTVGMHFFAEAVGHGLQPVLGCGELRDVGPGG